MPKQKMHTETITIPTTTGERQIEAEVFDGTGLAFHPYIEGDCTLSQSLYTVTHVTSGGRMCELASATACDRFIEAVADLEDWNQPLETFRARKNEIKALIEENAERAQHPPKKTVA